MTGGAPCIAWSFCRAQPSDRPDLVKAVAEVRNRERELHETRLPPQPMKIGTTRSPQHYGGVMIQLNAIAIFPVR